MGLGVLGMLLGVFAFDAVFPHLPEWGIRSYPQSMTLPLVFDVSYSALAVALSALVLLMVALADRLDPGKRYESTTASGSLLKREWGFVSTGVLAGLVILAATAQGQYLGISGGFAALVSHVTDWFLGYRLESVAVLDDTTAWRATMIVGIFAGAAASALVSSSFRNVPVTPLWEAAFPSGMKSRAAAVFGGGFLIIFGALLGGGCTTGAFMAVFPTLSVGSFAMGMTFFGAGMGTAFLLYWGRWRRVRETQARGLDLAND
ncbi:MAG: YeeE/YedE family protein [Gammaproteobacteria bacterium]|nr:YeeE/YedE family protein [Gammaproteobacteria bacterium]